MNKENNQDSGFTFFGLNFGFNLGCCAADRDDLSVSSFHSRNMQPNPKRKSRAKKKGMDVEENKENQPQNGNNDLSDNVSNNQDWNDMDDTGLPLDNDFKGTSPYTYEAGQTTEDVCPTEPFDYEVTKLALKRDVSADEDYEDVDDKSDISSHSKKIKKTKQNNKPRTKQDGDNTSHQGKIRGQRRRAWQPHEDAKVIELVSKYGQSWALIASMMQGRSGKQIRDRYLNKLKPNIKKGDWTEAEDQLLLNLYYQMGHKWSKISTYLPGRTEGMVKNRFYSHIKKRILGYKSPTVISTENQGSPMLREGHISPEISPANKKGKPLPHLHVLTFGMTEEKNNNSNLSTSETPNSNFPQQPFISDPADVISYNENPSNGLFKQNSLGALNANSNTYNPFQGVLPTNNFNGVPNSNGLYPMGVQTQNMNMLSGNMDMNIDILLNNLAKNYQPVTGQPGNTPADLERIEALNKRKKQLELLLFQTMQEMQTVIPNGQGAALK